MRDVLGFVAIVATPFLLIGMGIFLQRKTHCIECGGLLSVPVPDCTHGVGASQDQTKR